MSSPIFDSTFGTGRFRREEPMMTPFTPKEDRMTITDDDLNYLRNINTRPGPNAGKSIDPTKPGPDADRASPEPQDVREALNYIYRALDPYVEDKLSAAFRTVERAALAQSDALPTGAGLAAKDLKGEPWTSEEKEALQKIQGKGALL